jgi:hypothetical protein
LPVFHLVYFVFHAKTWKITIEDSALDNIHVKVQYFIAIEADGSLAIVNSTITRLDLANAFIGSDTYESSPTEIVLYRVSASDFKFRRENMKQVQLLIIEVARETSSYHEKGILKTYRQ